YKLQVLKGDWGDNTTVVGTSFVDKEDVKLLGKDIRYIQTGNFTLSHDEEPLFGTLLCWLLYLIPLLFSLFLFVFFRKQIKENSNLAFVRNKKANSVARKRLKIAQKLLNAGDKDKFYEEVLKATWTYLSDKLSIPVASLTKERVELELASRGVDPAVVQQFTQILNTCEFARYAPNSGQQEMGNLYDETIDTISELENFIKKS
ncbi:MAG: protein BatD, partial [Paludibacter sp.]